MREYEYNIIKSVDRLNNISDMITVNGVTINNIDLLIFKEYHREYIIMSLHNGSKEIANILIRQNQKLVIDETTNSYTVASV